MFCRTLRGVRGLKHHVGCIYFDEYMSHPSRGAWIETSNYRRIDISVTRRTLRGVRGLKLLRSSCFARVPQSHPSRGAWIETPTLGVVTLSHIVAPFAGCVD